MAALHHRGCQRQYSYCNTDIVNDVIVILPLSILSFSVLSFQYWHYQYCHCNTVIISTVIISTVIINTAIVNTIIVNTLIVNTLIVIRSLSILPCQYCHVNTVIFNTVIVNTVLSIPSFWTADDAIVLIFFWYLLTIELIVMLFVFQKFVCITKLEMRFLLLLLFVLLLSVKTVGIARPERAINTLLARRPKPHNTKQ